jgi:hypothetical protein
VLNALRHQRNWNKHCAKGYACGDTWCSTPYGIKGIGTRPPSDSVVNRRISAQRLTASKELEPLRLAGYAVHETQCSTPYGIKGIGTATPPCSSTTITSCAQRLTASKELERHGRAGKRCHLPVLNALRHQRNWNHTCTLPTNTPLREVLNALRHQRNWNSNCTSSRRRFLSKCSTPYGIKGIGTVICQLIPQAFWACSTPYGIKGIGTRLTIKAGVDYPGVCSTPYGIKGIGTSSCRGLAWCSKVLNALRHQRNWNKFQN